jgi:ribosomal protein L37AE/L43A
MEQPVSVVRYFGVGEDVSYCPECGAKGYERKTKTPKWRCRKCDYQWNSAGIPSTTYHPFSNLSKEVYHQQVHEQRQHELDEWYEFVSSGRGCPFWDAVESNVNWQRVQANLSELERKSPKGIEDELKKQEKDNKERGQGFAIVGFFLGAIIGRSMTDSNSGAIAGAVIFIWIGYYLGKNWYKWRS